MCQRARCQDVCTVRLKLAPGFLQKECGVKSWATGTLVEGRLAAGGRKRETGLCREHVDQVTRFREGLPEEEDHPVPFPLASAGSHLS